jgi:hypothetical protein
MSQVLDLKNLKNTEEDVKKLEHIYYNQNIYKNNELYRQKLIQDRIEIGAQYGRSREEIEREIEEEKILKEKIEKADIVFAKFFSGLPFTFLASGLLRVITTFLAPFIPQGILAMGISNFLGLEDRVRLGINPFNRGAIELGNKIYEQNKNNPIANIIQKTELSPQYKYLLNKNKLDTFKAIDPSNTKFKTEVKNLQNEIDEFEKNNKSKPNLIPYLATKLGDYPLDEIKKIFTDLTFSNNKNIVKLVNTNFIEDAALRDAIENLKNAQNKEDFIERLDNLKSFNIQGLNGQKILLGLIENSRIEEVKKEDFETKLNVKYNSSSDARDKITLAGLNPELSKILIDPPRGIVSNLEKAFKGHSISQENFYEFAKLRGDTFYSDVWGAEGLTEFNSKDKNTIRLTDGRNTISNLMHENTHAIANTLGRKNKNEEMKIYDGLEDVVHKAIYQKLVEYSKQGALKNGETNISLDEKIEEMLKIFGLEKTAENTKQYDNLFEEIKKMITGEIPCQFGDKLYKDNFKNLKYDFAKIFHAILTFENIDRHPLGVEVKRNIFNLLNNDEALKEQWKVAQKTFHDPDLFQGYDFSKNNAGRAEESIARINEKDLKTIGSLFPNAKSFLDKLSVNLKGGVADMRQVNIRNLFSDNSQIHPRVNAHNCCDHNNTNSHSHSRSHNHNHNHNYTNNNSQKSIQI